MYKTAKSAESLLVKNVQRVLTFSAILADSVYIGAGTPLTYDENGKLAVYTDHATNEVEGYSLAGNMISYDNRNNPDFQDPQKGRITLSPQGTAFLTRCKAGSVLNAGDKVTVISQDLTAAGMLTVDTAILGGHWGKVIRGGSAGSIVWILWKDAI